MLLFSSLYYKLSPNELCANSTYKWNDISSYTWNESRLLLYTLKPFKNVNSKYNYYHSYYYNYNHQHHNHL